MAASGAGGYVHIYRRPVPAGWRLPLLDWTRLCFMAWHVGHKDGGRGSKRDIPMKTMLYHIFHHEMQMNLPEIAKDPVIGHHHEERMPHMANVVCYALTVPDAIKTVACVYEIAHAKALIVRLTEGKIDEEPLPVPTFREDNRHKLETGGETKSALIHCMMIHPRFGRYDQSERKIVVSGASGASDTKKSMLNRLFNVGFDNAVNGTKCVSIDEMLKQFIEKQSIQQAMMLVVHIPIPVIYMVYKKGYMTWYTYYTEIAEHTSSTFRAEYERVKGVHVKVGEIATEYAEHTPPAWWKTPAWWKPLVPREHWKIYLLFIDHINFTYFWFIFC